MPSGFAISSLIHVRIVLSGTPHFRATAQMLFAAIMSISTPVRVASSHFRPRRLPLVLFLQYRRSFPICAASFCVLYFHCTQRVT